MGYTPDEIHAYEIKQLYEQLAKKDEDYIWMMTMYCRCLQEIGEALDMEGQFAQDYGTGAMLNKINSLKAKLKSRNGVNHDRP